MAGSATIEGVQDGMEERYRGATPIYVFGTLATMSPTSTCADAVVEEQLSLGRVIYTPGATTVSGSDVKLPSTTVEMTNTGVSPVSVAAAVAVYGGKASGGGVISSISGTTITSSGHGLSNGDKVIFTNEISSNPTNMTLSETGNITIYYVVSAATNTFGISATAGGGAIALGSSWVGTLYVRCTNGVIDPGYVSSSQTISPGQALSVTLNPVRRRLV